MALPTSVASTSTVELLRHSFIRTREEQLEEAAEYAVQEANRRRRVKREKNRLAQQRCRARKKERSSSDALSTSANDVPDMDVPDQYDQSELDDEVVPQLGDNDGDGIKQRSDRLEQNKQAKAMHILTHQLSVGNVLSDGFQPCCCICFSHTATFHIQGHNVLYCAPCLVQAYPQLLRTMRVASYDEQRPLQPVELAPLCLTWSHLPLSATCAECSNQRWIPQAHGESKLVLIDNDGIWQYSAADYRCEVCNHYLRYTDPLTYTSSVYLPGSPIIATVVVTVAAIEQYIVNRHHVPQFSVSAFVKTRGGGPEVGYQCLSPSLLSPYC
jgi:hypothetical protein